MSDHIAEDAKLFINNFGINPKTGEEIFETREADDLETRRFIYHHMMNKRILLKKETENNLCLLKKSVSLSYGFGRT